MKAYINYPNPHIQIHHNDSCPMFQVQRKADQRVVPVTVQTLERVLTEFIQRQHGFSSTAATNDMWLNIDLTSEEQEEGFVYVVQALLGIRYRPFSSPSVVSVHC